LPIAPHNLYKNPQVRKNLAVIIRSQRLSGPYATLLVCVLITALVWAVFGQTRSFSFVNFDDRSYVYQNPEIRVGLNAKGFIWAWTHFHAGNWHPLTTIVHMANCGLFGLNPGAHHLCNVTVHALTAVLLFLLVQQMLGSLWLAAWLAAVFAVHPLRVESVAWVSELKDVLAGLFFVLTLWAYFSYAGRRFSPWRYALVIVCLSVGLLCKPMLVTVPFVLLLMDFWPLRRFERWDLADPALRAALLEKLPLVALAAGSCAVTLAAQAKALNLLDALSYPLRLENALLSYAIYIQQTFLPIHLSVFYPFPASPPSSWTTLLVLGAFVGLTALAVSWRREHPWLLVGWLWFLGMLVPVIGVLQVGEQAHADRYTYLPQIGLLLILASVLGIGWNRATGLFRVLVVGGAVTSVIGLAILARQQTTCWRNSEALWTQALKCNSGNARAHLQLGTALYDQRKIAGSRIHCQHALEIQPSAQAHHNLATTLEAAGDFRGAVVHYRMASLLDPRLPGVFSNLGGALVRQGDLGGAIEVYRRAIAVAPDDVEARNNLGQSLGLADRLGEALEAFRLALVIQPNHFRALVGLLETLKRLGKEEEAVPFLVKACSAEGADRPKFLCLLTEVYARAGNRQQAFETAHEAVRAAEAGGNQELIRSIRGRVQDCLDAVPK
jgi:tetratricopeptide (TPR) repeat protein